MVGITQSRSIQDEKLIESIFQSHRSPESRASNAPIYGATATNLIIDARPTANAVANTAKGAGTENMDNYRDGKKLYLGIDHIHVMRESLAKVVEALREADNVALGVSGLLPEDGPSQGVLDRQALRRSGWLRHITAILEGSVVIARNIHINSSHVLIHCSDGWDRTSQLSALSQVLLDPFYRTMRGFQILIEKDWLSFGYKFMDRCGHLSSEKFFVTPAEPLNTGGGADAAQAFLASVQHRFASQHHLKETSPVFHQFLEAVRQVQRQFPDRFEFNQRFLKQLYYHLYSCQFGTFLYNCERERRVGEGGSPPCELTVSVWDFFNSPPERGKNINETYNPSLDDPTSRASNADMGVLFPNTKDVRFWHELYGRGDEEMNGRIVAQSKGVEYAGPVESAEEDLTGTPLTTSLPPSPAKSAPLALLPSSPGSRSGSPSLVTFTREMSSSLPDIVSRSGPDTPRMSTSTSALSSQAYPLSPSRSRVPKQADFLTSSGVKSVWGKLSSNASAALSVVQDAYVGVAKDLKAFGAGGEGERTEEMHGRELLGAWGEANSSAPPRTAAPTYAFDPPSNPWASIRARPPSASLPFDNPWSSIRASPSRHTNSIGDLYESNPSLADPTVAPSLMSTRYLHSNQLSGTQRGTQREPSPTSSPSRRINSSGSGPPTLQSPVDSTDPLGVGPL
jgi:myotubularin-related protein 6/7/8